MTRFKVTYSKEYTKIIHADTANEAMFKFNRQLNDSSDLDHSTSFINAEEEKL